MIVCICHRVSDRDIARAAREGCASFEELQFELSVATACGACHDCARSTFALHAGSAAACHSSHAAAAALSAGARIVMHPRRDAAGASA